MSIDAATVAAKWEHAVAEVERVDTEFTQYTYDLISETVILSDGRLVCKTGGQHFLSLKCAVAKAPSRIKKRSGQSFNVIPGRWERWIRNDTRILSFDDDKKEAWTFAVKRHEGTSVPPTEQKWWYWILNAQANAFENTLKTIRDIGAPCQTKGSQSDVPNQAIGDRFQINISNTNEKHVYLRLTPQWSHDAAAFQSIDVILSRETWLPDALQILDPTGTKQTVYLFRKRRVNFCPEEVQSLYEPDLTGYVVQSDELR